MSEGKKSPFGVICLSLLLVVIIGSIISTGKEKKEIPTPPTKESTTKAATTTEETTYITTETTEARILYNAPFVGMGEDKVWYTSLGEPTEVEKCLDYYKLRPDRRSTTYIWCENGKTIFSARACQGIIVSVYDGRTPTTSKYSYSTKKHTTHYDDDPYHARDYDNVDDFYDDHYGDFEDIEDAEDYYEDYD